MRRTTIIISTSLVLLFLSCQSSVRCDYVAAGFENYIGDIRVDGIYLSNNGSGFSFPYAQSEADSLKATLLDWMNNGSLNVAATASRRFYVKATDTEHVFEEIIFWGDSIGTTQYIELFNPPCEE